MRLMVTGSKEFGDRWLMDVVLSGLERQLVGDERMLLVTGNKRGAERVAQSVANHEVHPKIDPMVFDGTAQVKLRKNMIKNGQPNFLLVFINADPNGPTDMPDDKGLYMWIARAYSRQLAVKLLVSVKPYA